MAIKINKEVTLQGNVAIQSGSFIKLNITTDDLKDKNGNFIQLIRMNFYKDETEFDTLNHMPRPMEIPFKDFNISLTESELASISPILVHNKAKEFLAAELIDFEESDLEIIL